MATASPLFDDIARRLVSAGYDPTKAGEAIQWLIKACHPAWTGTCGPVPDHAFSASVCPDYTVQITIEAPNVPGNWDFIVWQPAGDCTAAVIGTGAAGIDFTTRLLSTNNGADGNVVRQYLYFQPLGGLAGVNLTQIPGTTTNSAVFTYPTQTIIPVAGVRAMRPRYGGLTVYPVASSLYDQGTIYAGQFARAPSPGPAVAIGGVVGQFVPNATTLMMYQVQYVDLPFAEGPMALLDPASKAWPFRNGAYLPKRFVNPAIDFVPMAALRESVRVFSSTPAPTRDITLGLPPGINATQQTYVSTQFVPTTYLAGSSYPPCNWLDGTQAGTVPGSVMPEHYDSAPSAMSHPVVIGRGLAPQASITIRAFVGLEYVPAWDSPVLQFSRAGVSPAPMIMDLYHAIVHDLGATVYPSSFNSLGTILSAIGSVVKSAFPTVARAVLPPLGNALMGVLGGDRGRPPSAGGPAAAPPRLEAPPLPSRNEVAALPVRTYRVVKQKAPAKRLVRKRRGK